MEDNKNTLWKSKSYRYRYNIFAVVRQSGDNLVAWQLELRGDNVFHPAFGLIPKEYIADFDIFTHEENGKVPDFIISTQDKEFYSIGSNVKQILGDSANSILF